jgi:hypothetical protein
VAERLRRPPPGVPTEPAGDERYVPLTQAAERLHMDPRTVRAAITSGEIRGWVRPSPQRLRWFVYEDQLPPTGRLSAADEVAALRAEVSALREEVVALKTTGGVDRAELARAVEAAVAELRAELVRTAETATADLRARLVTLTETNLLLIQAQEELGGVTTTLDGVAQKYRRALAMFMTPGHPGELENG